MKCPKCGLINPDNAQRCDCGYDFEQKQMVKSYLVTLPIQRADKLRFAGGLLFCLLSGIVTSPGLYNAERVGGTIGGLCFAVILPSLIAYAWKGRKKPRDWKGISIVFINTSLVILLMMVFQKFHEVGFVRD